MLTGTRNGVFSAESVRSRFPVLSSRVYDKPLVYLDNAATTQKPDAVIRAITELYSGYYANVHRGVHKLSQLSSEAFDKVRLKVRDLINARSEKEIVFVKGTTDGLNLVASCFGSFLKEGDEVLVSGMEHHSNIVPWQILEKTRGIKLVPVQFDAANGIDLQDLRSKINAKTRFLSLVWVSNSLGTVNPVREVIEIAHSEGIPVMIDAAQAIAHKKVDVQDMDCDFLAFSAHKMYGPTGAGVLYAKESWLEKMPPYQGGGDMISSVSFQGTTYNEIPFKFEAGTPNIEGVIGMGVAIDFLSEFDLDEVGRYEAELATYCAEKISDIKGIYIIGGSKKPNGILSFAVQGVNSLDIGMMLDTMGIAVRTGYHCTEPALTSLSLKGSVRASFAMYNTYEEADQFCEGLKKAVGILG